ncbi:MAG TPA: hypothetical protein VEK06_04660 [Myxococcota bacterium]|nr:hypothetical protein [Myxococcota bacterium]
MERYSIAILVIMALFSELVLAVPINFGAANLIKALNRSIDRPILLYQSTDPGHAAPNQLFTTQTIARLEQGGVPPSDFETLRNEICANFRIQTTASGAGTAFNATPGAIGIYLHNDSIVEVYDDALMGERLDSVLRKLKDADVATKIAQAAAYARQMAVALDQIHGADITWNNASLNNFYVRPDGSVTAIDFSAAKNSPGGMDTPDKKNERMNFLANTVRKMYEILFPTPGQANAADAYGEFTALLNPAVAALGIPSWIRLDLTQANFTTGANPAVPAVALPPTYIPGVDGLITALALDGILRAAHTPAAGAGATVAANMGAATGFVLDAAVVPYVVNPVPGGPAFTNLTDICAAW